MDFGSAAHGAFEAFTRERRDRLARGEPPPTRVDLERCFESAWARTSLPAEADAEFWRRRAEPMLDRFWAAEPADAETVGEELRFRLHIPLDPDTQVVIAGFIDRIDRLPSGAVELIDYKTGTSGPPEEATSLSPAAMRWTWVDPSGSPSTASRRAAASAPRAPMPPWTACATTWRLAPAGSAEVISPQLRALAPAAGATSLRSAR
jgi:RecB family exonuclease